jgi:hypothetical protein
MIEFITHHAENFLDPHYFYNDITQYESITTSVGDAKIPFVSSDDIADVIVDVLTTEDQAKLNREYVIVGPELLTYDEVEFIFVILALSERCFASHFQIASKFASILRRPIAHRRTSSHDEALEAWVRRGYDPSYAEVMELGQRLIEAGAEEKAAEHPMKIVGKVRFDEFLEDNKGRFDRSAEGPA